MGENPLNGKGIPLLYYREGGEMICSFDDESKKV